MKKQIDLRRRNIKKTLLRWIFQYIRIIKKIKSKLPNYHPQTGVRLNWDIYLGTHKDIEYSVNNGSMVKSTFIPKPFIKQRYPNALKDHNSYIFDWSKKKIIRVGTWVY